MFGIAYLCPTLVLLKVRHFKISYLCIGELLYKLYKLQQIELLLYKIAFV